MDNQLYIDAVYQKGVADAKDLQQRSAEMDGTALYSEEEKIPDFKAACAKMNMLERPVGFVCKSSAGRVVKLLQVYDSTIYTGEPEELPAQWGFKWSTDPSKALPFIALSTSPYMVGDCCTEGGKVWRSLIDNNVHAPSAYPQGWQDVATDGDGGGTVTPDQTPEPQPEPEQPSEQPPEWKQPTGGHDAYKVGDRVTYNGKVYESTINGNVWAPDAYPQGWQVVD
nr:MAG TPA: hypothetical protein [Caudoviricetes sp.]